MTNEINFNDVECIKEYSTLKETTYINICTNETYKVPMSITGYFLIALGITAIFVLLSMAILMIKTCFDKY